mmetsp:Transcript_9865/g.23974  ORF Transcript_9865/g.23974 Transcript_9865/m.23974 type:complete len:154 (+) Transcript_9865:977-1438(+)
MDTQTLQLWPKEVSESDYLKSRVATHALVFQVAELSGATKPMRFRQVVAIHGVVNLTAVTLHRLFWETVRNLQRRAHVRIVATVCDGASCNRLFQKINTHNMGRGTANRFEAGPRPGKGRAWCENPYVDSPDEDSKIWFMSDPSHWVKKVVSL